MVELAQAGGQLAAAGAGGSDHHQLPGGLDVVVAAKALGTDYVGGVGGIARNMVVMVYPDAHALQPGLESPGNALAVVAGEHHAGHVQTQIPEHANEADHVPVIGDAQVATDFVFLDVIGVDGNDHLHLLLHLQQHPQLAVRLEAGKHPGGVIVVIQLAAEFQVQLAAELPDSLPDVGGLGRQILVVVKSQTFHADLLFRQTLRLLY